MKKRKPPHNARIATAALAASLATAVAAESLQRHNPLPPLPVPVSNNAVASLKSAGREYLVSFSGIGRGKTHSDVHARTFVFNSEAGSWREHDPVPGGPGRLASVALAVGDRIFVFGGYTVAEDGSEVSTPWVHAFDPASGEFEQRASMPVPVDDAVAVAFEDRYIYLISGWHDFGNVNLVQRYDTVADTWEQATPTPGTAVFGHAGGIVDDVIVYCDGVGVVPQENSRRKFAASSECYAGYIDEQDGREIDWRVIPPHPGPARYRMAAAGVSVLQSVLFIGGSSNPYNFNGIGYNGEPSSPEAGAWLYKPEENRWIGISTDRPATMDHRALVDFQGDWLTVGGMTDGQRVADLVNAYRIGR